MATAEGTRAAIRPGWQALLDEEFASPYMADLRRYLAERKARRAVIYPHSDHWFRAFMLTEPADIRVVILGQDPYHGPGQAHGLSFSVPRGVAVPPSLLNVYKEIDQDIPGSTLSTSRNGCLEGWAEQGVFLLNSVLTVEQGRAGAHRGRGWEQFTDRVIAWLNETQSELVFMLWGSYAQKKGQLIDARRHLVLRAPHPSPLSAHRGFLGCRHFSRANAWLQEQGRDPINWQRIEPTGQD